MVCVRTAAQQFHYHLHHSSRIMKPINLRIAEELGVREPQVAAAISLLDGGATVPFVARYRKEATGHSMTRNCVRSRSG